MPAKIVKFFINQMVEKNVRKTPAFAGVFYINHMGFLFFHIR